MKKLLVLIFVLFSYLADSQQLSELTRGLVFSAPLSEWGAQAGAALTSGTLTTGKTYAIGTYVSNDDFTNVGAASNAAGQIFIATGTTPTHWAHASILKEQNYGTLDLVSKTVGVNTATYPVLDKRGSGRREFLFDGVNDYVTLPTIPAFGTGDFTVIIIVDYKSLSGYPYLLGAESNGFSIYIDASGKLVTSKRNVADNVPSTTSVSIGKNIISYHRTGTVGTYYVNGISAGVITDALDYSVACSVLGTQGAYYLNGSISMCRIFNYALTPTQITNYSKPEYPIEWVDRGYSGELITPVVNRDFSGANNWTNSNYTSFSSSGALTVAGTEMFCNLGTSYAPTIATKKYRIQFDASSVTGVNYVFSVNIGQLYKQITSATGQSAVFTATTSGGLSVYTSGTGGATLDNFSLLQLGCVLDLNAEGATSAYWYDKTNTLTGTVSGATLIVPPASNLGGTYFNGTTSKIVFPDNDNYTLPSSSLSICFKANFNMIGGNIISKHDSESLAEYEIYVGSDGIITYYLFSGANTNYSTFASPSATVVVNIPCNFVFTWNGTTGIIYKNGVAITTTKANIGSGYSTMTNTSSVLNIGKHGYDSSWFGGIYEGISLYNRVFSADDAKLYNDIN